jgi:hypothetical protein
VHSDDRFVEYVRQPLHIIGVRGSDQRTDAASDEDHVAVDYVMGARPAQQCSDLASVLSPEPAAAARTPL